MFFIIKKYRREKMKCSENVEYLRSKIKEKQNAAPVLLKHVRLTVSFENKVYSAFHIKIIRLTQYP